MSYYNFNDHFWSPKKVCSQSTQSKSKDKIANSSLLLAILSLAFIALATPLILPKLVANKNNAQGEISLNNNLGNKCILIGHERLQIHCPVQ